jgi:RNA polymerase sigma factor (sigma-70 family)
MPDSVEVATADAGDSPPTSLTDAQVAAFWDSVIANQDAARKSIRKIVGRDAAQDLVHTGAIRFLESLSRGNAQFPATSEEFTYRFLRVVRTCALDCVRDDKHKYLPHFNWGKEHQPDVHGHKLGDRDLSTLFGPIDKATLEVPAPEPLWERDDVDRLDLILQGCISALPPMQQKIVAAFMDGGKRRDIAEDLKISPNTYDNHLRAAFSTLRKQLTKEAAAFKDSDPSRWYAMIEDLRGRHDTRQRLAAAERKRHRSKSKVDRSTSARARRRNTRVVDISAVAPAKSGVDRSATKGDAGKSNGRRDKTIGDGDELVVVAIKTTVDRRKTVSRRSKSIVDRSIS